MTKKVTLASIHCGDGKHTWHIPPGVIFDFSEAELEDIPASAVRDVNPEVDGNRRELEKVVKVEFTPRPLPNRLAGAPRAALRANAAALAASSQATSERLSEDDGAKQKGEPAPEQKPEGEPAPKQKPEDEDDGL